MDKLKRRERCDSKRVVRVAMVQMQVQGGMLEENLNRAVRFIHEASEQGADVVLLPECMDLGWTDPSSQRLASGIPDGKVCQKLKKAAQECGVYVSSGVTEQAGDQVYNAAVLIDREGKVLGKYRKIHELKIGKPYYGVGDRLTVWETEFGRVGMVICADANVPGQVLTRSLARMGAQIILSPAAWAVPADHHQEKEPYGELWRNCYQPVARDFNLPILGVSNVGAITGGPWEGRKCIGCSLAVGKDGDILTEGGYGKEEVLYVDVEL